VALHHVLLQKPPPVTLFVMPWLLTKSQPQLLINVMTVLVVKRAPHRVPASADIWQHLHANAAFRCPALGGLHSTLIRKALGIDISCFYGAGIVVARLLALHCCSTGFASEPVSISA
jgi:hypothetical protein